MDIILATANGHKIREIRALLKSFPQFDIYTLLDFPHYIPPEETGLTFKENAIIKANHAAQALNKWTIADDSGLVVPALGGSPGVYSARYAGKGASDKDNRKKLLHAMQSLEGLGRAAYFECCIAVASPDSLQETFSAICEGTITTEERGSYGFGYDPIFLKHDYNLTFAELSEERKNLISHRAKALEKLKRALAAHSTLSRCEISQR